MLWRRNSLLPNRSSKQFSNSKYLDNNHSSRCLAISSHSIKQRNLDIRCPQLLELNRSKSCQLRVRLL